MAINIEIEVNGEKVKLSMEEAKRLHGELSDLFGEKQVLNPVNPQLVPYPSPSWPYPIITC